MEYIWNQLKNILHLQEIFVRLCGQHTVLTVESGKFELIGRTGNVGADTRLYRAWCLLSRFRPIGFTRA